MSKNVASHSLNGHIRVLSGFPFPSSQFTERGGIPLIRIRDLQHGTTEASFSGSYDPAYLVRAGDVLVGMDGDFSVVRWQGRESLLNQRVCKIAAYSEDIDQGFLYWWLQPHLDVIHRRTPETTVRHLAVGDIYRITMPEFG